MKRLLLLAVALTCGAIPGQFFRSTRRVGFKQSGFVVSCHPAVGGTNTISLTAIGPTGSSNTVPVQVKYPGDALVFSGTGTVALVGQDFNGKGVLHILTRNVAGVWSVHGTYTTSTASDFVGVGYSQTAQRLYLLDATNKKIAWASYAVGAQPPTSWTTLANDIQAPILASVATGQMWMGIDGSEPILYVRSASPQELSGGGDTDLYTIKHTATGPVVAMVPGQRDRAAFMGDDTQAGLKSGATQMQVSGPPGAQVEALNVDDIFNPMVIGTATLNADGDATITTSPLLLGSVYGLRTNLLAEPVGPFVSCVNKWGTADQLGNSASIRAIPDLGLISYVGHQYFRVPILIDFDGNQVTIPTTYNASLIVGTVTDPIIDVDPPNGRYVLLGSSVFSTTATIFQNGFPGFGRVALPIPNDPDLVNSELRYQWWVTLSPTDVRISDIQGAVIRGSIWVPPGAEDYFGVGQPLSSSSQVTRNPKRKVWRRTPVDKAVSKRVVLKWLATVKTRSTLPWHDVKFKAEMLQAIRSGGSKR